LLAASQSIACLTKARRIVSRARLWWPFLLLLLLFLLVVGWSAHVGWTAFQQHHLANLQYQPPPPGMVFVPPGDFLMGSDDPLAEPDERPLRRVFVRGFYIDRLEVTNREFQRFKPSHRFPAGEEELPATFVHKHEAQAYCRWAGRRLPTDAEWEKAARGTDGRVYPWGNPFDAARANVEQPAPRRGTNALCLPDSIHPSQGKVRGGSFPSGASPYGCEDMAGNVWEWVEDEWKDSGGWLGVGGCQRRGILRGGAATYSAHQARVSYHGFEGLETTCHDVGFRSALDARPMEGGPKTNGPAHTRAGPLGSLAMSSVQWKSDRENVRRCLETTR
jgi:formylglycine-generating enzyme required for sulfatase activity